MTSAPQRARVDLDGRRRAGGRESAEALRFLEKITGGPLTLGRLLESIRLADEISQAEMARKLGLARQHLHDIEKGRRFVSPKKAVQFAVALGYSAAQFLELVLQEEVRRMGIDLVDVHVEARAG